MNFKESVPILAEIKKANNILLAFHEGVDPDSICSNLVLRNYLQTAGKKVQIVCGEKIIGLFKELYDIHDVVEDVDFKKFNFKEFDLFITLDVNDIRRLRIPDGAKVPVKTINIDHHATQNYFDCLRINDSGYSSTSEMIYYLLEDFGFNIDVRNANLVLLGLLTDTESFNYNVSPRVFRTVSKLLEIGADFDRANVIIYRNNSLNQLKFWAIALNNMKVDKKYKFAYTAISFSELIKLKGVVQAGRSVADKFARTISETDFGIVMTERESGELKVSIRSRERGYGVIPLLESLGGGGHFDGGGGKVNGLSFDKAVAKVLRLARKFVNDRKNQKN